MHVRQALLFCFLALSSVQLEGRVAPRLLAGTCESSSLVPPHPR